MAFKKIEEVQIASTEIVHDGEILPDGTVQVRKRTISKDAQGNIIKTENHRHVCHPGDNYDNEPQEVKDICQREHTPEKIQARKDFVAAQEAELNG